MIFCAFDISFSNYRIQQLMIHNTYLRGKLLMLKGIVLYLWVILAEYLYYGYSIYNDHAPRNFPVRNYFDYLPVNRVPYYWITFADLCLAVFLTFIYLLIWTTSLNIAELLNH